ncbi:GGDEF domain-containing protein [Thioalkalivibrio sp.]|uniref:GGDEF domain-containing protein n=1 Tax=Thioalkalivibrio sp. TaxID=2093813 RepID=UPI003974AC49
MKQTTSPGIQPASRDSGARSVQWPRPGLAPPILSALELAQLLQTSLELERILDLFSQAIQSAFPHDGLVYENTACGLHIHSGRLSRHSCSYHLTTEERDLGEIRFVRGRKFRDSELHQLENLLAGLVYPLRNALLYRLAVEAAQTDPLTGLHNRAALDRLLPRELARFQRGGQPLAMLVIDLDHFKKVNDTLGHSAGDEVLQAVARCLEQATRKSDMVFRSGGEEFVVLLHVAQAKHGVEAGERIRRALEDCDRIQEAAPGFLPTASIGLAIATDSDTPRTLFDRADQAMYAAKSAGRNRVHAAPTPR